jgi:sugar phosphate isomerase/epimerase
VGHFNSEKGDICEAICLLGTHLSALHVHDDRYGQDRHLIPFQGETDWNGFVRGLKAISFDGVISLETRIQPGTPQPIREALELQLSKIARYFADEIEK